MPIGTKPPDARWTISKRVPGGYITLSTRATTQAAIARVGGFANGHGGEPNPKRWRGSDNYTMTMEGRPVVYSVEQHPANCHLGCCAPLLGTDAPCPGGCPCCAVEVYANSPAGMADAHADGLHSDHPREGCPGCADQHRGRRC